jgi:hypothetical protein
MSQQNTDRTTDITTDRRVPVLEASELLGLTPDAVRARLRRGTLRKERGHDGTLYVVLDDDVADRTTDGRPTEQPTVALLGAKDQTISHLSEQLEFLRQELREEREGSRRKDHLLAAALERIPAIEAPPDTPPTNTPSEPRESPVTPSEEQGSGTGPAEEPGAEKRSWWRRVFLGE